MCLFVCQKAEFELRSGSHFGDKRERQLEREQEKDDVQEEIEERKHFNPQIGPQVSKFVRREGKGNHPSTLLLLMIIL